MGGMVDVSELSARSYGNGAFDGAGGGFNHHNFGDDTSLGASGFSGVDVHADSRKVPRTIRLGLCSCLVSVPDMD